MRQPVLTRVPLGQSTKKLDSTHTVSGLIHNIVCYAPLIILALLSFHDALAQEPNTDIGQIVTELDQLEDVVEEASRTTADSTWRLFLIGIGVSVITLAGVFLTGHYLKKQAEHSNSHLNFLRQETRGRLWSALSWTTFEDGSTHRRRQSDEGLTVTVRILNLGSTPALNITSQETHEMITSKEDRPDKSRTTTRFWGSLSPNGFMEVPILVLTDEHTRASKHELFRAKITFYYTAATGKTAYDIRVDYTNGSVDVQGSASEPPGTSS